MGNTNTKRSAADRSCRPEVKIVEQGLDMVSADVIVNSCNQRLLLDRGHVSKTLLKKAGSRLQLECRKKYPNGISFGNIAVTGGYKLQCKKVYHVALPPFDTNFADALQSLCKSACFCLSQAEEDGMTSIAFPTLGCGFLNYPCDVVAQTLRDCLSQFMAKRTSFTLRHIFVCVWPKGADWKHIKEAFVQELMGCGPSTVPVDAIATALNTKSIRTNHKTKQEPNFMSTCYRETRDNACTNVLGCGHKCLGYRGEQVCLPCLQPQCAAAGALAQTAEDDCMVCHTDQLGAAPVAKLQCGHLFHLHCVKRILQYRWIGPKINFNFTRCPLCKVTIEHPELQSLMSPLQELEQDVRHKAMMRLDYDKLTECPEITDPSSPYYRKPEQYAVDRYIYYICFQCKQAFFGGTESTGCSSEEVHIDPEKLICLHCRGANKHDQDSDAEVAKVVYARRNEEAAHLIKTTTKACPHCEVRTEKNGGCNHMTCGSCHMDWCWVCEKVWCEDCKRTHWQENMAETMLNRAAIWRILLNDELMGLGLPHLDHLDDLGMFHEGLYDDEEEEGHGDLVVFNDDEEEEGHGDLVVLNDDEEEEGHGDLVVLNDDEAEESHGDLVVLNDDEEEEAMEIL